ncbi:MAG: hypothetical protein JWM74_1695, partial [Myxococcaceae bacterium]|nr:hypothetical protein [Myxococcaceae bacterium]
HEHDIEQSRRVKAEKAREEAAEKKANSSVGLIMVAGILTLGAGGGAYVAMHHDVAEHEHDIDWDSAGDPPVFADVNGDGTEDFIGTYWKPEKGEKRTDHDIELGSFDGAAHTRIWKSGPFGRNAQAKGSTHFAVTGGKVVLTDYKAVAHILDLAKGKELTTVKLPDRARALCPIPGGSQMWIDVLGDRSVMLDVAKGTVTPAPRPATCIDANARLSCASYRGKATCLPADLAPAVLGMRVDRALADGGDLVVFGTTDGVSNATRSTTVGYGFSKDGGMQPSTSTTRVVPGQLLPNVSGVDPATRQVRWQIILGTGVATTSTILAIPSSVAELTHGRVYAQYELKSSDWRLASIDAKTGSVLWDIKVQGTKHGDEARSIVLSTSRAYLAHGDWLDIYDTKTGTVLGDFGR